MGSQVRLRNESLQLITAQHSAINIMLASCENEAHGTSYTTTPNLAVWLASTLFRTDTLWTIHRHQDSSR
jgi:hypothetical protein